MLREYDDIQCTLVVYILHEADKHGCNIHDTLAKITIHVKTWRHVIPISRFDIEHTSKGSPACQVASKISETTVVKLIVDVAANVKELILQILFVLQKTSFF